MIALGAAWRVFVSHTSEFENFPASGSYVAAVKSGIAACGHVAVDMEEFPSAEVSSVEFCVEQVRSCDVYLGILGTCYGSLVRGGPVGAAAVSYSELEFDTAAEAGLDRLVFLLDTDAENVGIPPSRLLDRKYGTRQEKFRTRAQEGLTTHSFSDPSTLKALVIQSLTNLDARRAAANRPESASGPERESASHAAPAVVIAGEIPQQPLGFQPRPDLLAQLEGTIPGPVGPDAPAVSSGSIPHVSVVTAVTGQRGVGKTHLAAAYARDRIADRWDLIAWVNAEDEVTLLAGLAETAAALGLPTNNARTAGKALRHYLEADGDRCLLVFDNAADPKALRPFLPVSGASRVIITSNNRDVAGLGTTVFVDVFTEAEALTFLATRTGLPDPDGAESLAKELGCLPLALAQAAAVIATEHLTYAAYLDRLRRLPAADLFPAEADGAYPLGLAATVLLSLDYLRDAESGACSAIMSLLSVLSPSGVRRTMIHAAAAAGLPGIDGPLPALTPEAADRALARLSRVSLLTFAGDGVAVTAHRLVLRVIRETLIGAGAIAAACSVATDVLATAAEAMGGPWSKDPAPASDLAEQVIALEEVVNCYLPDELGAGLLDRLKGTAIFSLADVVNDPARTVGLTERLVAERERALGLDHPDTLVARSNLAMSLWLSGRATESIALYKEILEAQAQQLGADHPETLATQTNLAGIYSTAGQQDDALAQHSEVFAARVRTLGPDHPDTLRARGFVALGHIAAGRETEATALFEELLAAQLRVHGPEHPGTLQARSNLAGSYLMVGREDEAVALLQETLAARVRVRGADHPDTLETMDNLARAYRMTGLKMEAVALLEQTLAARVRVQGPDHADTQQARNNLASAYRAVGRVVEAVGLYEGAVATALRMLGRHPDTLKSLYRLADAYREAGRAVEADWLEQQLPERAPDANTKEGPGFTFTISVADLES